MLVCATPSFSQQGQLISFGINSQHSKSPYNELN